MSSARVVRCWVKSRNERNPCLVLPAGWAGDSRETAGVNSEEGGDDVLKTHMYEIVPGFLLNLIVAILVSRLTYEDDPEVDREFARMKAAIGARSR